MTYIIKCVSQLGWPHQSSSAAFRSCYNWQRLQTYSYNNTTCQLQQHKMSGPWYTDKHGPEIGTTELIYGVSFPTVCQGPKAYVYSVSQKIPLWGLVAIFPKWLGIFQPNFTCLLRVPIYARLRIFIQLSATLTNLCHIKRDHPVHIMCAKCPPAETHAGIFWHFPQTVRNF